MNIHLPVMLHADQLVEHENNSNRQSSHVMKELEESIKENGFDESLLVIPTEDDKFMVVSGNHRLKAGLKAGMTEFPCVVREDWDDVKAEIESVRRNYVRGAIDREAFSLQVDRLEAEAGLSLDAIQDAMGFQDEDAFAALYREEADRERELIAKEKDSNGGGDAPGLKILEDLGTILSGILAQYGHTVPNSFIVFPAAGKFHLYVASNPELKKLMEAICEHAVAQRIDVGVALTGLLKLGAEQVNFLGGTGAHLLPQIEEGESDLEPID